MNTRFCARGALGAALAIAATPAAAQSSMAPCNTYDSADMRRACMEINGHVQQGMVDRARTTRQQLDDKAFVEKAAVEKWRAEQDRAREVRPSDQMFSPTAPLVTNTDEPRLTPAQASAQKIRGYKAQIARLQAAIEREKRIGRTSGFVNKQTLYQAGEFIEQYREKMAQEYRTYRAAGGRKALGAL